MATVDYRPPTAKRFKTAMLLQTATPTTDVLGVAGYTYTDNMQFNCDFRTYGGTEAQSNGVLSVIDTAQIICWYNPLFQSNCRVKRLRDNAIFEILGEPENYDENNMFLTFKVRRVKGGA